MRNLFFLFMLMLTFQVAKGQTPSKKRANYPYLTYLPNDYLQKKYPLVIFLHGSSLVGNDLNKLKQYGLPKEVEKGRSFDFIAVSPQCPSGKLWSSEDWFGPLYEELLEKYPIDTNRVYLTGVSMGGGGVFDVAKDYPDAFAALAPLCAWASTTERICNLKEIPIWTFHGTKDDVVPISQTESKVKALKDCQGNIEFTRLEGEGHSIHWLYEPESKYDIFAWLLKHSKN